MLGLEVNIFDILNPFSLFRRHIRLPIEAFLNRTLLEYKRRTNSGINNIKELVLKCGIIALVFTGILWISVFLYIMFYYTYMPNITHTRPVHLQFKSCDEHPGICSYPSAHVELTRRQSILMVGQMYRIRLILEMPESYSNKELGMFMVCAELRSKAGSLVTSSCRSVMLRYRSRLHRWMRTVVLSPLLLTGIGEEKQLLHVELFSDFQEDQGTPATDVYIELQSRHVHVYSAGLHIEAHFTGLRYFMFNWPIVSATLGISTNLLFVALVFILSWYHITEGQLYQFISITTKPIHIGKIKMEKQDSEDSFIGELTEDDLKTEISI